MWVVITIIAVCALAVGAAHYFRWPLFNAAIRAQRARAQLDEKTVHVDGHDIHYLDGGSGEPLLLIHGFGANKDNWIEIAPRLFQHFRLIIPDLPGFGDSTRDPDARYDIDTQCERLHQFIDELKLDNVHLAGNSMGGYLSGVYAAKHPERVDSQWLLAPAGVQSAQPSEFFEKAERGDNALLVRHMQDFDRLVDLVFTKAPYVPRIFKRCLCERNVEERSFNEKIFGELLSDPPPLEHRLQGCAVRTQILWGDGDRILDKSGAHILDQVLENVETHILEQTGHCPMIEKPAESAKLYLAFHGIA